MQSFPTQPCRTLLNFLDLQTSFLLLSIVYLGSSQPAEQIPSIDPNHHIQSNNPCYDEFDKPQRCVPDFINAAFNLQVEVTNTCGVRSPTHFCVQTGHSGIRKVCDVCDDRVEGLRHPAKYLTDFNNANNETWWQSETMNEKIQYPNSVNLTLRLGKTFDITYVRLKFISPRPESFAIYKKTRVDDDWVPWQYYSGSCYATYKVKERVPILPGNEAVAQCTREFSDISPLTGGNIPFSTLEGRPSSHNFEESEVLQEWVTASEIRIVLNRMNTFGDEVFKDPKVLRSYYYAISDFAVGGRCKCNGHASECVKSTGDGEERLVCRCEHNTEGADCEKCKPFYNDRPWRPGTANDANECLACNCNQLSSRCYFDQELYDKTGRGGHCIDCAGNTQGPHCEECATNTWRRPNEHYCVPCNCNDTGSLSSQCDSTGQCACKPGVGGERCDRCKEGFYDFSSNGCKDCQCQTVGSKNNAPFCDPRTGECSCKLNVEGRHCDRCKPGYFDLSFDNQFGCTPCFCFGHSSVCTVADGYYATNISSEFDEGKNKWRATTHNRLLDTQWSEIDKAVATSDIDGSPVYFVAPEQFTGDQRSSYNQDLWFTFRLHQGQPGRIQPSQRDIVIVGGNGNQELSLPIYAQNNPHPNGKEHQYRFRIHANPEFNWSPRLNELDFIGILANVTTLRIRATYGRGDLGFLSNVHLGSASLAPTGDNPKEAKWVESCTCSEANVGQFCESCAPGYRRAQKYGGPFNRCVKCECHNHSSSCEAESGACICEHNTSGETCEVCARGYYGDALQGTPNDCTKCPCPQDGPCRLISSDGESQVMCTDCPNGYMGLRCDSCADGYFGNPREDKPCVECECNGNIDPNNIGNCDSLTGECKKCVFNTIGFNCEKCQKGYWGDALREPKGDCKPCNCYVLGTKRVDIDYTVLECRQSDGQCECQLHVTGLRCDKCENGYFNLTSGTGCQSCDCDPVGSISGSCDVETGQCKCKKGVTGRRCDECAPLHFGFGEEGCEPCDCEPIGSESAQCHVKSGQCLCRDYVEGRRCDTCMENRYNLKLGCLACDECYTLVQRRVRQHRDNIAKLEEILREIVDNPAPVNDTVFDEKVKEVEQEARDLANLLNEKIAGDDTQLVGQVNRLKEDLDDVLRSVDTIGDLIESAYQKMDAAKDMLFRWSTMGDRAKEDIEKALAYLEEEGKTQWELAKEVAEKYGEKSQKLSDIAQEARKLADLHENRSQEIEGLAQKTMEASKQAVSEAQEAIWGGESISQQIAAMLKELNKTADLLNETKKFAEEQLVEANQAYIAAGNSLTDVEKLKIPDVHIKETEEEIKRIEEDMMTAVKNAQEQAAMNKGVLEEAERVVSEAKAELQRALAYQQESDNLLGDVDAALTRAKEAISSSNKTLAEAQNTLQTLQKFHDRVEDSKAEAIKELEKLDEIKQQIKEAEKITEDAEKAIGNAGDDAKTAAQMAAEAQNDANLISSKAHQLRTETAATLSTAKDLRADANTLSKDVDQTSSSIDAYAKQAAEDGKRATDAASRAAKAKNIVNATHKNITDSGEKLKEIINALRYLDVSSDGDLDALEADLEAAEKRNKDADLDTKIKELSIQKGERERVRSQLAKELSELENEVLNLEEILKTLPEQCYNKVPIESEGQK